MSGFDPTCLINTKIDVPWFMDKGKAGHYNKLEPGINWSRYTLQYFQKESIFEIIDQVIKNRKPIFTGIFGETGNGKTSLVVTILQYLYRKYSPAIDFTPQTFHRFYWLGRSVTLDPIIVVQYFRTQLGIDPAYDVFLVIEEAEGVVSSDRGGSIQNQDARYAMDTLRANKIHLIFVAINIADLDRRIREGRLVLRLEVLYNDIDRQKIEYNALVWARGYYFRNREYTDRMGYVVFAENQYINWCSKAFHDKADELKQGKIYGDDISAYISSNESKEFKLEKLKNLSKDELIDEIRLDFEEEYDYLPFDKVNKITSMNIVRDNLIIPIIQKLNSIDIDIGNTQLDSIVRTTKGMPERGVDWRPVIRDARIILSRSTNDDD